MDYKVLLEEIEKIPAEGTPFSAISLWTILTIKQTEDLEKNPSLKEVSNELGKLYKMGFLTRKRVKREVRSSKKAENRCNRGFMYLYTLSSAGNKYVKYLKTPVPFRQLMQSNSRVNAALANPAFIIYRRAHPELLTDNPLLPYTLMLLQQNGHWETPKNQKRFPPRVDPGLHELARSNLDAKNRAKDHAQALSQQLDETLAKNKVMKEDQEAVFAKMKQFKPILAKYLESVDNKTGKELLLEATQYFRRRHYNPHLYFDYRIAGVIPEATPDKGVSLITALGWIISELENVEKFESSMAPGRLRP